MAIVTVQIPRGTGAETKRKLVQALTGAVADVLDMPHTGVTVLIGEFAPENWAEGGELRSDRGKAETIAYDLEALFRKPPEKSGEKPVAKAAEKKAAPAAKMSPRKALAKSRSRR
ncbi:MAG TPA: tautomerase family protein [Rhizomicrobium sp.]|jgi:4-oxalocrotonate tautomerase family enzyme|nr:tautomerase family protein [Rhizomicrobium sp.]